MNESSAVQLHGGIFRERVIRRTAPRSVKELPPSRQSRAASLGSEARDPSLSSGCQGAAARPYVLRGFFAGGAPPLTREPPPLTSSRRGTPRHFRFAVPKKSAPCKARFDFLTAARNEICFIRHRRRKSRFPQTPSSPPSTQSVDGARSKRQRFHDPALPDHRVPGCGGAAPERGSRGGMTLRAAVIKGAPSLRSG